MPHQIFLEKIQIKTQSLLEQYLPSDQLQPLRLHQAMRYSALNPGKRLRPALVYATGEMLSAKQENLDIPALAVELIHAYSLIHDDLPCMDDPKSIGPAMAVALLTTLYGAIMANMVGIPIADKLNKRDDEEKVSKKLIIDGLLGIQAGQNPRVIEQVLHGYLAEGSRPSAED